MADVQVAVGFGRKPGDDLRVALGRDVGRDDVANEVLGLGAGWEVSADMKRANCGIGPGDATLQFAAEISLAFAPPPGSSASP